MRSKFALTLCILLLMANSSHGFEAQDKLVQELGDATSELNRIEQAISSGADSNLLSGQWGDSIQEVMDLANSCLASSELQLEKLETDLAQLGEVARDEPIGVTRKRVELQDEKKFYEQRNAKCRLLILRSDEIRDEVASLQKRIIAERLLSRGESFATLFSRHWQETGPWLSTSRQFLANDIGAKKFGLSVWLALVLTVLASIYLGYIFRQQLRSWVAGHQWDGSFPDTFIRGLATTYAHYSLRLAVSIALAVFFFIVTYEIKPTPFTAVLIYSLPLYFLISSLIHLFLVPQMSGKVIINIPEAVAKALARRLKALAFFSYIGFIIFATILAQGLPEQAMLLARGVFATVFILNAMWVLWLLGRIPYFYRLRWLRVGLNIVVLSALLAEWAGYRNLSITTLRILVGTLFALGVAILFTRLLRETYDGIEKGRRHWHRRLRRLLSLKPTDRVPGLLWIRIISSVFLWGLLVFAILRILGLSDAEMRGIHQYIFEGFTIGSLTIIPVRIFLAIITVAFLLTLNGWFRSRLEQRWLSESRLDRGAREAIVTMSGYIGIALAIIISLSVTGVEFSNLAIIAGALSVGIGFGLQNIVNNFVSGLILLFERPIKTGDWIVAGVTEGYVKRIRMRSTQIQTFDRADVIVPNSELISSQVTNWMLYNTRGRVRIAVGVAYGSDTQLVKEILTQVAQEHEEIIVSEQGMEPKVLFLAFGDSALNFELRCFVRNIDRRLQIISDLNFAIDAAFRARGIEIPFPQRDVHVRDFPRGKKE